MNFGAKLGSRKGPAFFRRRSYRRSIAQAIAAPKPVTPVNVSASISLPQDDSDSSARQSRIQERRATVEWNHDFLPGLAIAKRVPDYEAFTPTYVRERMQAEADVKPNQDKTLAHEKWDPLDRLDDFENHFLLIDLPAVAKVYKTDESFAEQRLSGANPLAIRVLAPDDPRADVLRSIELDPRNTEHFFDVEAELQAGNVYICDYTGTAPDYHGPGLVAGATTPFKKYLPKPLVFYRWDKSCTTATAEGSLKPVAIQIEASSDPDVYTPAGGRIYTPTERSSNDWLFAKICAQCADGNHHEMSSHLARTHFVMEPVGVAATHCFDVTHPLSILLRVHMRFIMANNFLAHGTFFKDHDGNLENLLPGTLPETKKLLLEAHDTWGLKKHSFPQDLRNRGLDDADRLPHYPYRDDGYLLWNAINTYVTAYVEHFYPSDQAIADDAELQAWAAECADMERGGKVKEMPTSFSTRSELIEVLAIIVYACGPLHSAVNFTQMDYLAFVPNMPLAVYQNITELARQKTPISDKQIMALMPPSVRAIEQLNVVASIGRYHFDVLGYYDKSLADLYNKSFEQMFQAHEPIRAAMERFQSDLALAEEEITRRNADRKVEYRALLPSQVMNSISI